MGHIRLTKLILSPLPTEQKVVTVQYKLTSDVSGPFITDTSSAIVGTDGVFAPEYVIRNLNDGASYTINVFSNCGGIALRQKFFTGCGCAAGYTASADSKRCEKIIVDDTKLHVTQSNYCLAPSRNPAYSSRLARIYNQGFSNNSIAMVTAPASDVFAEMTTNPQWSNPTFSATLGVMNREGVWIDSDCNGVKDSLILGTQTTIAFAFQNTGAERIVYVGLGADNQFILKVNGDIIAQTTVPNSSENFKIWHLIPVLLKAGWNDFNAVATGDGSVNDSIAMVIYDNAPAQIRDASSDTNLNILFKTSSLIGSHIDIATCDAGWTLDTSGGQGFYHCRQILTQGCGEAGCTTWDFTGGAAISVVRVNLCGDAATTDITLAANAPVSSRCVKAGTTPVLISGNATFSYAGVPCP